MYGCMDVWIVWIVWKICGFRSKRMRPDAYPPALTHTHTQKEGDGNVFPNSDPNSRFLRFSQNFETVTSTPLSTVRGTERETRERERRERERREGGGREERRERR